MEKQRIEAKAQDILRQFGMLTDGQVDVLLLAQNAGFVVGNANLDDDEDGIILVNTKEETILGVKTQKLIGVNARRDLPSKRFVIAHELGHYFFRLDKKTGGDIIIARRERLVGRDGEENEMDYFAACLLMPADAFRKKYGELKEMGILPGEMPERLSKLFNVPLISAERRMGEVVLAT
jgi:Zn-dependent peptidase ImmA (M78 family)